MKTIKLNQVEVKEAIRHGNGDGQYFLAVAPDGTTRLWYSPAGGSAPWPEDNAVIVLPSLFDGEGADQEESLDWVLQAFLDACNGDGTDLNRLAPWGYEHEYGESTGVAKSLPFEFEWEMGISSKRSENRQ